MAPLPKGQHSALLRYRLLLFIAATPMFFVSLWQAIKHKDMQVLLQRYGIFRQKQSQKTVWFHAASVGEVLALKPLIEELQKRYPKLTIAVSTFTPTGAKIVRQQMAQVAHYYLPLDIKFCARRFVNTVNPCCAFIMETELWPHLYNACGKADIPMLIINARLSQRTMQAAPWIKQLYRFALSHVTAVLAKSQNDASCYIELGAEPQTTQVIGNLKYAVASNVNDAQISFGFNKPYVLAASTHDNEEQLLARAWKNINLPSHLLVIAPRHPYRTAQILKQLKPLTNNISVRSKGEAITEQTQIYLADTLGEMLALMQQAELVFMGGSLVPVGGHNILEPGVLGKTILFGPHMHNFDEEAALFLQHHAAVQIADISELEIKLKEFLNAPQKRQTYGERAKVLMQQYTTVTSDYLEAMEQNCDIKAATPSDRSHP